MFQPIVNSWGYIASNNDTPASPMGVQFTTANTPAGDGSWVSLLSAAAHRIRFLSLVFGNMASSGSSRFVMADIGIDPAGGTSYTPIISDLMLANFFNMTAGGGHASEPMLYRFPCDIPEGSQIAVRGYGGGSINARCWATFFGKPKRPELLPPVGYCLTPGTYTPPNGISFTPGNASWGSWASLGTLDKPCWWHELSIGIDNTAQSEHSCMVEFAHGDGSNKHLIFRKHLRSTTGETAKMTPALSNQYSLPAGTELWVRGNNSAAPVTGYQAVAHCVGG